MGYMVAIGFCYVCGNLMTFNPHTVPSIRNARGVKEPVCKRCVELINQKRREAGLPEFLIPPDVYEPAEDV